MSTTAAPSVASHLETFPLARLRVIAANKREKPRCLVRLAISHRLYWMAVDNNTPTPNSLYAFNDQNSLALERLPATATWEDVTKEVAPHGDDGLSFMVPGRLHGRARWSTFSGEVGVVITATTTTERNTWMNEVRLRISPPQALQERAKTLVDDDGAGAASVASLTDEMKALFISHGVGHHVDELKEVSPASVDEITPASSRTMRVVTRVHSAVPKVDWIEKINAQLTSWTGFVASAVKKSVDTSEIVANTAQDVADHAKFIPGGVSSVFHLVALSARLVVMFAEANRGCRELPNLLAKVMDLLDCVAGSVVPILNPASTLVEAEKILEGNVFQVLVTTFDLSGKIEEQLMRGKWSRLVNSGVLKEVESELATLKQMVVSVALTKQMKGVEVHLKAVQEGLDEVQKKVDGLGMKPAEFVTTESFRRPEPSPFFFGRHDELLQLKKAIQERGSAAITGLGGIGKTQLMATFAERIELDGDVPGGVFWVTADGTAKEIIESLAVFAEKMHGQKIRNEDRSNRKVVVEVLRTALQIVEGRWMLCVDNLDYAGQSDVNVILGALTSMAGRDDGWVVVTSRTGNPNLWRRMKPAQNVVLKAFSPKDAMCVMLRLKESIDTDEAKDEVVREELRLLEAGNRAEFEALQELAECLFGLPLALAQAAAYIRSSQNNSFSEYLQLYRTATKKSEFDFILRRTEDELVPVRDEQRGIFSTWQISVDRLSDEAVFVLHAVAMFGSAPIPGDLLKAVLTQESGGNEAHGIRYARVVDGELVCSSSLLQKYQGDGKEWFDIHRLVRLFVVVSMEQDYPQKWDIELCRVIKATHSCVRNMLCQAGKSFYDAPDGHGDRQFDLLPHTRSIMHHREKREIISAGQELVELYHFNGSCLHWKARFSEAEEVYDALLNMQETIHGIDVCVADIAVTLHQKGIVCQELGKLKPAEAMYKKSLEMALAICGSETPNSHVSGTYIQLGAVYADQGKFEQAEAMYNKGQEMLLAIHGTKNPHPDLASAYHNLGTVYSEQGRFEQAEAMYNKSLDMKLAIHGAERPHAHVAGLYNDLGGIYRAQGKLEQAEIMHNKSLDMKLAIYGADRPHPALASSYHQLGNVFMDQGRFEQAEAMYNESLDMELAIHGAERPHPSLTSAYNNLGLVYNEQGKLEQAEAMYNKGLKMNLAIHGTRRPHPDIAMSYNNLGNVYQDQGRFEQAEAMYNKSLKMDLAIHGTERPHPDVASTYLNLGVVYKNQRKLEQAEAMFNKSLEMNLAVYGSERPHPEVAGSYHNLGVVYHLQGKLEQAEVMYGKGLEMKLAIHGSERPHPDVALTYHQLGNLYVKQGKLNDAEEMIKMCLDMELVIRGPETPHPSVANILNSLGTVLEWQGHREQALGVYSRAVEMNRGVFGADSEHPQIVAVMTNIQRLQSEEDPINEADNETRDSANGNLNVGEERNKCCTIQ